MDNDDEMMTQLFREEEANATTEQQQQLLTLGNLLLLCQHLLAVSTPRRGGLRVGKASNKDQHRQAGATLLDSDYFADNPTHTPNNFQRRFRTNKGMFMKIVFGVREYDTYFMCKQDCTSLRGFSSIQKCTTAMRCLAYGAPVDAIDDYLRMAESTCFETVTRFCRAVVAVFVPLKKV
jgi:hypothetical protein